MILFALTRFQLFIPFASFLRHSKLHLGPRTSLLSCSKGSYRDSAFGHTLACLQSGDMRCFQLYSDVWHLFQTLSEISLHRQCGVGRGLIFVPTGAVPSLAKGVWGGRADRESPTLRLLQRLLRGTRLAAMERQVVSEALREALEEHVREESTASAASVSPGRFTSRLRRPRETPRWCSARPERLQGAVEVKELSALPAMEHLKLLEEAVLKGTELPPLRKPQGEKSSRCELSLFERGSHEHDAQINFEIIVELRSVGRPCPWPRGESNPKIGEKPSRNGARPLRGFDSPLAR